MPWSARCAVSILLLGLLSATWPVAAQPAADPDWPCAQRLVPQLSAATIWQGPALEQVAGNDGSVDVGIAALAPRLVDRSTPVDEAARMIQAFAAEGDQARRDARLTALFRAVVDVANGQRVGMIEGLKRFGVRQRALAAKINGDAKKLRDLQAQGSDDALTEAQDLQQAQAWDTRVFDERQHTVRIACDQPVQVDQRAFALARTIAEQLK